MDSRNRLTKNSEWEVGARYRYTKGRPNQRMRATFKPMEAVFLGWAEGGKLEGVALLRLDTGTVMISFPGVWRQRWVKIASPELATGEAA